MRPWTSSICRLPKLLARSLPEAPNILGMSLHRKSLHIGETIKKSEKIYLRSRESTECCTEIVKNKCYRYLFLFLNPACIIVLGLKTSLLAALGGQQHGLQEGAAVLVKGQLLTQRASELVLQEGLLYGLQHLFIHRFRRKPPSFQAHLCTQPFPSFIALQKVQYNSC